MFDRLRKIIGGSPQGGQLKQKNDQAAADPYRAHLELLQDTARDLCPDPWLANKLTIDYKVENGAPALVTSPEGSLPYIRAAYAMKKDKIPENMSALLKGIAS